jgi:hypothetical protein
MQFLIDNHHRLKQMEQPEVQQAQQERKLGKPVLPEPLQQEKQKAQLVVVLQAKEVQRLLVDLVRVKEVQKKRLIQTNPIGFYESSPMQIKW